MRLEEVVHVIIPGRGRDATGHGLSESSRQRVEHAGHFYLDNKLAQRAGVIVCSGYKTPADTNGCAWSPEDAPDEVYRGVPEADSAKKVLLAQGVGRASIVVERKSIDTTTNFALTEENECFGAQDDRPVAIVSQLRHLERMLDIIAPKTLRRDFLGIVVPEIGKPEADGLAPRLISKAILVGIHTGKHNVGAITFRRATRAWGLVNAVRKLSLRSY